MKHSDEQIWRLLARSISGQATDLSGVAEDQFLRIAVDNGVIALLHHRLSEGTSRGLTGSLETALKEQAQRQAALDLVLNDATRKFCTLLLEQDIDALLMKGTPMSMLKYDQSFHRNRCDTDVYIRQEDAPRIAMLLRNSGYRGIKLELEKRSSKQFQATRESFQRERMWFDIHYRLSNRALFQSTLPFEECLDRSIIIPELANARALNSRDLLAHACMHRIAHGRGNERNRLIWLYDIHLLAQQMDEEDWADYVKSALEKKIGTLSADALLTCGALYKTPVQMEVIKALQAKADEEPSASLIEAGKAGWGWADLKQQEGVRNKIRFLSEIIDNKLNKKR